MITMDVYYVQLQAVSEWKDWLIRHSAWYRYNIAYKQPIWQVYDTSEARIMYRNQTHAGATTLKEHRAELRHSLIKEQRKLNELTNLIAKYNKPETSIIDSFNNYYDDDPAEA